MKKQFFIAVIGSLFLFACERSEIKPTVINKQNTETVSNTRVPIIWFDFSIQPFKPRSGCSNGWGACNGHLIVCGFDVFSVGNVNGTATSEDYNGGVALRMAFDSDPYPDDDTFEVGSNSVLPDSIAGMFEASEVKLVEGTYDLTTNAENKREVLVPLDIRY